MMRSEQWWSPGRDAVSARVPICKVANVPSTTWRPGTTEIFQFTPGCFVTPRVCPALQAVSGGRTADEKVTFKAPKTGVFYIQVNGWYSGGRYKLILKRV